MYLPELRRRKINELDGFRALAILIVFVYHMGLDIPWYFAQLVYHGGWISVSLFFILSGFLLSLDFIEAGINNTEFPSVKGFYIKRVLRIFPLYFFSLIFYIIYLYLNKSLPPVSEILPHFLFLHNFEMWNSKINGPYWSLAVEVQVYILFPLIGYFIFKYLKKERLIKLIGFLILLVLIPLMYRIFITQYLPSYKENNDYIKFIYASTISNLDSFGWGIIAAIVFNFSRNKFKGKKFLGYIFLSMSLILIFYLMHFSVKEKGWLVSEGIFAPSFYYTLLNIGWATMITSILLLRESLISKVFSSRIFYFISIISYSIYIWHTIVITWVQEILNIFLAKGWLYQISLFSFSCLVCTLISVISWYFIEFPFLRNDSKGLNYYQMLLNFAGKGSSGKHIS